MSRVWFERRTINGKTRWWFFIRHRNGHGHTGWTLRSKGHA